MRVLDSENIASSMDWKRSLLERENTRKGEWKDKRGWSKSWMFGIEIF